jgi:hypothetical protein
MHERICGDCGRQRFDASVHPDRHTQGVALGSRSLTDAAFLTGLGGGIYGGLGG